MIPIIQNLDYRKIRLHNCNNSNTISLGGVTHTDKLEHFPPLHIKPTQLFGHTGDSWSGVEMFLLVVILVFAATCCTTRVIGKSLHTRH